MLTIDEFLTVEHRHDVDLGEAMIAVIVDHPVDLLVHDLAWTEPSVTRTEPGSVRLETDSKTPAVS